MRQHRAYVCSANPALFRHHECQTQCDNWYVSFRDRVKRPKISLHESLSRVDGGRGLVSRCYFRVRIVMFSNFWPSRLKSYKNFLHENLNRIGDRRKVQFWTKNFSSSEFSKLSTWSLSCNMFASIHVPMAVLGSRKFLVIVSMFSTFSFIYENSNNLCSSLIILSRAVYPHQWYLPFLERWPTSQPLPPIWQFWNRPCVRIMPHWFSGRPPFGRNIPSVSDFGVTYYGMTLNFGDFRYFPGLPKFCLV